MCALNAGILSGTYLVRFQAPHLRSIEFGGVFSSLSLSSVHLQLWLHLHLGNRTSALQLSSGVQGTRRWASVWSKPRPSALLLSARGGVGGVVARKWQQRPLRRLPRGALEAPASAARRGAVRLQRPPNPGAPAGPHKVCSQRPCTAELPERCWAPARRVRGDPTRPMLHRQTGACRENFEKLPRRNLLLQLASQGPREELV